MNEQKTDTIQPADQTGDVDDLIYPHIDHPLPSDR